jgi:hypothetical protein
MSVRVLVLMTMLMMISPVLFQIVGFLLMLMTKRMMMMMMMMMVMVMVMETLLVRRKRERKNMRLVNCLMSRSTTNTRKTTSSPRRWI